MYCKKCGAQIPDGSIFCSKCGEKLTTENITEKNNTKEDTNLFEMDIKPLKPNGICYIIGVLLLIAILPIADEFGSLAILVFIMAIAMFVIGKYLGNMNKEKKARKFVIPPIVESRSDGFKNNSSHK